MTTQVEVIKISGRSVGGSSYIRRIVQGAVQDCNPLTPPTPINIIVGVGDAQNQVATACTSAVKELQLLVDKLGGVGSELKVEITHALPTKVPMLTMPKTKRMYDL